MRDPTHSQTDRPIETLLGLVSSTWLDLQPERAAVETALQEMRETKFLGMEYFGSRDENTRKASLAEVNRGHIYLGIIGGRYGSGITETEYRRARKRRLPCFIYFKNEADIPAEGPETDPQKAARLAMLKKKLRASHTIRAFTSPDNLAAKVTADLHRWIFGEYLTSRLERAAQKKLPLEEIQALLAAVKDVRALHKDLRARLRKAGYVIAKGERSIAVGRDAIDSVLITGDHNVVYQSIVQRYPALRDYAYDFSELIATATLWFVGRAFLFDKLAKFQKQHRCGYIRIVADAGLGKTALAAEIARRYRAPAFFARASSGLTRPDQCLNHLSAELISRFALKHDHLPSRAGEDSGFLSQVLAEAVTKTGGPLWIVIDALDEADDPLPGRNPLLLPSFLPHGVYVVLTHRPGEYPLVTTPDTPITEYTISWNDPVQKADVKAHLVN